MIAERRSDPLSFPTLHHQGRPAGAGRGAVLVLTFLMTLVASGTLGFSTSRPSGATVATVANWSLLVSCVPAALAAARLYARSRSPLPRA
jgi:hypothetical protein